jgi:hypothetical protein
METCLLSLGHLGWKRLKFVIGVVAKNICCIKFTNDLMQQVKIIWFTLSSIVGLGVNKICKKQTTQKKKFNVKKKKDIRFHVNITRNQCQYNELILEMKNTCKTKT